MFKQEFVRRVLRFGVVGVVVMLVFMALNWLFAPRLGVNLAYLAAYPLAVGLHFVLNRCWTFGDRREVRTRQVSEYLAMMLAAFLIQTAVFKLLIHFTPLVPWLAAGAATSAQVALSFVVMHKRVFNAGQAG